MTVKDRGRSAGDGGAGKGAREAVFGQARPGPPASPCPGASCPAPPSPPPELHAGRHAARAAAGPRGDPRPRRPRAASRPADARRAGPHRSPPRRHRRPGRIVSCIASPASRIATPALRPRRPAATGAGQVTQVSGFATMARGVAATIVRARGFPGRCFARAPSLRRLRRPVARVVPSASSRAPPTGRPTGARAVLPDAVPPMSTALEDAPRCSGKRAWAGARSTAAPPAGPGPPAARLRARRAVRRGGPGPEAVRSAGATAAQSRSRQALRRRCRVSVRPRPAGTPPAP